MITGTERRVARNGGALPAWYVVQTHPREEYRAVNSIARDLGFRTYLPQRVDRRELRRSGYTVMRDGEKVFENVLRPFLPRYLFVSFDPSADRLWPEISRTVGVVRIFCYVHGVMLRPMPVLGGAVEYIQSRGRAGDGVIDKKSLADPNAPPELLVGETVRVADGPFTSFMAIVEELIEQDDEELRARVLVEIFGRRSPVELKLSQVERLG